jgi:alkanesulfonate monooxygenase SsuD/methylene tetrahydromethanopterin reductase-like flavin-dependent oxidoreductase (luciferase family)
MRLASVRLAAKHATRFNLIGPPEKCAHRIEKLEQFCAELGRDPAEIELSVHPTVAVARSRDEAETLAARVAARNTVDLEANRANWVIGDPADVTAGLRRYIDIGINHFVFAVGHPFDMAALRFLRDEVLLGLG